MKQLSLIIISILALSSLDAEQVNSADAPEGKVHIYKQEDDTAREMEIFFPKDHDPAIHHHLEDGSTQSRWQGL